jgi:DNA mismatch repair protein MutL
VSYVVEQAYNSILMKNKFPFFVLNIELNPLLVDANVSPAKTEVRFAEESYLSRAIYLAVSKALSSDVLFNPVTVSNKDREIFKFKNVDPKPGYVQEELDYRGQGLQESSQKSQNSSPGFDAGNQKPEKLFEEQKTGIVRSVPMKETFQASLGSDNTRVTEEKEIRMFTEALKPLARTDIYASSGKNDNVLPADLLNRIPNDTIVPITKSDYPQAEQIQSVLAADVISDTLVMEVTSGLYEDNSQNKAVTVDQTAFSGIEPAASENISKKAQPDLTSMKYIGQAFSTYILLQSGEELVMVDQHAAHERILYEKLKVKFEEQENTTQLLLEPVVIQFQALELVEIKAKQQLLNKIGFTFEDFGNNSIIIRGIPYMLEGASPKDVFMEIAEKVLSDLKPLATPLADEIIHTIACKAAIKANKKLNDSEVNKLLEELSITGRRYTCPHGRPTVIRLTKYEIEKMFKRIV